MSGADNTFALITASIQHFVFCISNNDNPNVKVQDFFFFFKCIVY